MELIDVIVSWLLFPTYCIFMFWMVILHNIVFTWLRIRHGSRLIKLGSADAYWAVGEKYHNLINVIMFVNKKERNEDITADIKDVISKKILAHPDKYSKLVSSLHIFFGYPYLLKEKPKAENFITIVDVKKTKYTSMKDLFFDFSFKPLPLDNKLMFEIIVVDAPKDWKESNNIKEDQVPMYIRINHTVADGLSVMNLCAQTLGENNVNLDTSLKNIPRSPEWQRIPIVQFWQNIFLFFMVPGFMVVNYFKNEVNQVKGQYDGPMTAFRHKISYRTEKPGEDLIQNIKSVKKALGNTSFLEVILTATSYSLHKFYEKAVYKVPDTINMAIVATKDLKPMTVNGVPQLRNQFGFVNMAMPIKMESESMLARLETLQKSSRQLYNNPTELLLRNYITFNLLEYLPLPVIKRAVPIKGVASVVSNLPEFPKLVMFNGHDVEDVFFFTLQRDQMANGFSIISYDGRFHLGFTGDIASTPTQEDCDEIINDVFKSIELLKLEVDKKRLNIKDN